MSESIIYSSAASLARLIREREVSATEVMRACLDRIEQVHPVINAVVELRAEEALREAASIDARLAQGEDMGPLAGVPLSVKDSIEVVGTRCTAGTLGRAAAMSTRDATLVGRLKSAGAIVVAKTNLPDLLFAFESDNLLFGKTSNPYHPGRTSGGSSGGEAALLATGGSAIGLGSDAAGSVRLPSHFCGTAGIKPTLGRLSRTGHVPPAGGWVERIWQIGPMARTVEDLQLLMPLLIGGDGIDPTVVPFPWAPPGEKQLRNLRVAFFTHNGLVGANESTAAMLRDAANALAFRGMRVTDDRPDGIDECYDLEMRWIGLDGGTGLRQLLSDYGSPQAHALLEGWLSKVAPHQTDLAGFADLWGRLDRYRATMHQFLREYDVILSPVYPRGALPHGESILDDNFIGFSYTMAYNMTGWPAAVVRGGTDQDGMPIGVQVAGHPWHEDVVLSVARCLEEDLGGFKAPPL